MNKYAYPLQLAQEALLLGRYTDALYLLKPLSNAGNTEAQFLHAYLHFWDDDLDQAQAIERLTQLADNGHIESNYLLAVCSDLAPSYRFRLPATEPAQSRLRFAAENGSDMAQTDLAQCYLEGIGVEQDYDRARELLQHVYDHKRSRRYLPKTCFLLGRMLLEGLGGEKDSDEGLRALARCDFRYADPYTIKAMALAVDIFEERNHPETEELKSDLEKIRTRHTTNWHLYLEYHCRTTLHYDLRTATYDDFVGFVFEHFPPSPEDRDGFRWAWQAEVLIDARILLHYYTQLFRSPTFLLDRYTRDEIERGLDMEGIRSLANWSLGCVMQSAENTVDEVEACIHAMYDLFAGLFTKASFDSVEYMWWDIGYGGCFGSNAPPKRKLSENDGYRLSQATFDTMVRVLYLNSPNCQSAAIHRLGHSDYPDKKKVLLQFLSDHPGLSERDKAFVMAAIEGKIL